MELGVQGMEGIKKMHRQESHIPPKEFPFTRLHLPKNGGEFTLPKGTVMLKNGIGTLTLEEPMDVIIGLPSRKIERLRALNKGKDTTYIDPDTVHKLSMEVTNDRREVISKADHKIIGYVYGLEVYPDADYPFDDD